MSDSVNARNCDSKIVKLDRMLDNHHENAAINTDIILFYPSHQHSQSYTSCTLTSNNARQQSASLQEIKCDFILDFLNDLKPFIIRLQRVIMLSTFTLPPTHSSQGETSIPDPTPKAKVPSFATRRAACTHLTMERLYGDFTCNVCSQFSSFGWVYCCTQDDESVSSATAEYVSEPSDLSYQHINGCKKEADAVNDLSKPLSAVKHHPKLEGEGGTMPTSELSPWIEKAIKDGHYTPEQVVKLRAQKQHVVDTAKAAIDQFEQSQTRSTDSSPQTPSTLQSVDANPHLPFPIINELRESTATTFPTTHVALGQKIKPRMFPFCKFCACQLCRPTYRDRAWQIFEDVFKKEYENPFTDDEDSNRPLASASVMSQIGLRPPRLPKRSLQRPLDSRAMYLRNEDGQIVLNSNDNGSYRKPADPTSSTTDIADMKVETESKGFRESMKRAFKSMVMTRRPSSRSDRRRKARDETDSSDEDVVEFDMGLWKEMNDELLRDASCVPLPEKDSVNGLSKEAAKMNLGSVVRVAGAGGVGGVAVTEEAADLKMADVIMSV